MKQEDRDYWLKQLAASRHPSPLESALRNAISDAMRWENGCKNEARSNRELKARLQQQNEDFNAAIDFAIEDIGGGAVTFLLMWREGNWPGIHLEFPEFKISKELENV